MTKPLFIAALFIVTVGIALAAFVMPREKADASIQEKQEIPAEPDQSSLSRAQFSFPVTEIALHDNVVSFTIPRDAHEMEEKADSVVLSGMYVADAAGDHSACPIVQSSEVDDQLQEYDPFSGKARVNAVFENASVARQAYEKGCLLVEDPE